MGVDKMIAEKLVELSKYYMNQIRCKDELIAFCNQYDVIYSNFTSELEQECTSELFKLFDIVFMLCDSYEPDRVIRQNEPYCIGEEELQKKVYDILKKIEKEM